MRHAAPLLMAVALAVTAAPLATAWADPDNGGRGGWRGGGGHSEGGGQGWRGGQNGGQNGGQGGSQGWRGGGDRGDRGDRGDWRGGQQDGGRVQREVGRYGDGQPYGGARGFRDPEGGGGGGEPQGGGRRAEPLAGGSRDAAEGVRQGLRPMGQVLREIQRQQPGRQLDAGMETWGDGRPTYRVRWAAENGRRIDYVVDARTGAILSVEGR